MKEIMPRTLEQMPELMESCDLVELGLYSSINTAYLARVQGRGPSYVKMDRKVLYPKAAVLDFLKERMKDGSKPHKQVVDSL